MVPFPTIPPSESFGRKDFFDSLRADEDIGPYRCAVAEIGIGIQMVRSKTVTWVMTSRSKSEPTM